jgi:uncharacterized protein (TIGR02147 family)
MLPGMRRRALVDVFGYRDYRAFLAAYYARRKEQKDGFSFARFSEEVELRSPNYLKLVIDGERNLSPELAQRFGAGCGLRDDALEYFCALVGFDQASSGRSRPSRASARVIGSTRRRAPITRTGTCPRSTSCARART